MIFYNQEARIDYLIEYLLNEDPDAQIEQSITDTFAEKVKLFRGLANIRPPAPIDEQFIHVQDAFLTEWNKERPVTTLQDLKPTLPQLYVWQGDITTLAVDAIVNAANSDFIGCMEPNHNCIDNIIHTRAGVQLRLACDALIQTQGRKEAVGKAKITKAYNLPSDYVIHTVGPFIDGRGVTPVREKLLASSYRSSLALAEEHKLQTIAFCCISTGVFNFPNEQAAVIAIETVQQYLRETESTMQVVFNVFKEEDLHIYQSLLGKE